MTASSLDLAGETFLLDPAGILVWPRLALVAVADLHLEKGSAAACRGSLVPPWDSRITLDRLAGAVARYRPGIVVAVGDSFHDGGGAARMSAHDRARLAHLSADRRMIWIAGNHDPRPMPGIAGEAMGEFAAGPLVFRHQAGRGHAPRENTVEVSGHHHPKARVTTRGGDVVRPCFVACANGRRLMLPAFGAFTGGLDVRDPAIGSLFPDGGRLFLIGARVFSFALPPWLPASHVAPNPAAPPCVP